MSKKTEKNIEIPSILENNQYGKIEWIEKHDEFIKSGKLSEAEKWVMITYCSNYGNWVSAEIRLQQEGLITYAGNGTPIPNPLFGLQQGYFNSMMKAAMQIGLTPKTKIKSGAKAKITKLASLKQESKIG
jgi:P27 family predicted phage terminase small subunit